MNVIVRAYHRHGEGQTTCCSCAYRGLGTGSRCWDSMMFTVYVNDHRVGYMCSQCLRDMIHNHETRGHVVVAEKIERGDDYAE